MKNVDNFRKAYIIINKINNIKDLRTLKHSVKSFSKKHDKLANESKLKNKVLLIILVKFSNVSESTDKESRLSDKKHKGKFIL